MTNDAPVELLPETLLERAAEYADRVGHDAALDGARAWLRDGDPGRRVAVAVLAHLGSSRPDAQRLLFDAARGAVNSPDAEVRGTVAEALAQQHGSADAHDLLMRLVYDVEEDVRLLAIEGLAATSGAEVAPTAPVVFALLRLLHDPSARVRDMAAFALGRQLDVDSPGIRDELLRLATTDVDNEDVSPAGEAAIGLARRGDDRVAGVIADRLDDDEVGRLWLDAAAELGAPQLHELLVALQQRVASDAHDEWDQALAAAIDRCAR